MIQSKCQLVIVLILLLISNHLFSQTIHKYTFSFKEVPYTLDVKQYDDHYEIGITSQKLQLSLGDDSADPERPEYIKYDGFEANNTTSSWKTLPIDFSAEIFKNTMLMLILEQSNANNDNRMSLQRLLNKDGDLLQAIYNTYQRIKGEVLDENLKADVQRAEKSHQIQIDKIKYQMDSLAEVIDVINEANRYGGQFKLVDSIGRGIPIYFSRPWYFKVKQKADTNIINVTNEDEDEDKGIREDGENGENEEDREDKEDEKEELSGFKTKDKFIDKYPHYYPYDTNFIRLYPQSVVVKTFNNFIDMIHVEGTVKIVRGEKDTIYVPVDFYNGDNSISLRDLKLRDKFLAFRIPYYIASPKSKKAQSIVHTDYATYLVNISDLIRVTNHKKHVTFMIKNDAYELSRTKGSVSYERRNFYDYLNFTTFLDFLGIVEKTPNSLIQIEGRIRVPFRLQNSHLLNKRKYVRRNVFFPKIDGYLNASFINGSQSDTRFAPVSNLSGNSSNLDSLFIDNFDLIRKNNVRTGLEFSFLKKESKASNLNLYFDYGIHFIRTSLIYSITNIDAPDEFNEFQTWSYTHGPITRWEYRPDQNIGMDLSVAVNFKQKLVNSNNNNLAVFEVKGPLNSNRIHPSSPLEMITNRQRTNYKLEFNTYFMVNPAQSNGGLYFRLQNYFSYDFKQLFPQVMIGYSTRLNGMIKNLKQRSEKE